MGINLYLQTGYTSSSSSHPDAASLPVRAPLGSYLRLCRWHLDRTNINVLWNYEEKVVSTPWIYSFSPPLYLASGRWMQLHAAECPECAALLIYNSDSTQFCLSMGSIAAAPASISGSNSGIPILIIEQCPPQEGNERQIFQLALGAACITLLSSQLRRCLIMMLELNAAVMSLSHAYHKSNG